MQGLHAAAGEFMWAKRRTGEPICTPRGPLKRKQVATLRELEGALTKTLRTHPECNGSIRVQKITRLHDPASLALDVPQAA
jgi:hypothetical protein